MSEIGILSFGAYLPRSRLQRAAVHAANAWFAAGLKGLAQGERAAANWDEDSITMAVEAARDALADIDRTSVGGISLASTTLPFLDRLNSGVVKEALGLSDATIAFDATGNQRAATSMLIQMLRAASGTLTSHLCVAAELRKARPASEGEMMQGDAAAAMLVGSENPIARFLGSHSVTIDFVDHYRAAGMEFDYAWESRWIRDEGYAGLMVSAVKDALKTLNIDARAIDKLIIPITVRGVAQDVAKKVGIRSDVIADTLAGTVGDSGAAHPFLLLASALETATPGQKLMLVGFGQGADVIVLETTPALAALPVRRGVSGSLARGVKEENYLRFLFHRGLIDLDRGMRAEFDQKQPGTTLWRNRKAVLGLIGGRCTKSGVIQFPKSDISVNPSDHALATQEDYRFAERRAKIVTYTADNLTYSPSPPQYYGMVDFDGGGRMMLEFTDLEAADVAVGRQVEMMFRIKGVDERRDFIKYFWKAVPITGAAAET
jgi:hydroxymethylglutaryl-CoA synthase